MPSRARPSADPLLAVLDTAPVMIWMSGPDAKCNYFNHGWLTYTGRRLEDELGDGWAKGVHADDLARCFETYMQHFERREPFRMEYRLRRADGEYGWVIDDGAPRYAPDGEFLGFIGSCVDITERKLAERVLRSQMVTKELARGIINDLIGRARVPPGIVREFGRSLSTRDGARSTTTEFLDAFDALGFGRLQLLSASERRYEFGGTDLLERRPGAIAPMCYLTLGYLEGAVDVLSGRRALGTELSCQSAGHAQCRFVIVAS